MQIFVQIPQTNKRIIVFKLGPSDTIEELKRRLHVSSGYPVERQRLTFNDKELENDHTISDYSIQHSNSLVLTFLSRTQIVIQVELPSGRTISLDVQHSNTIAFVKMRIKEQENVQFDQLKLTFNGKELKDKRKLSQYKIQSDDILRVEESQDAAPSRPPSNLEPIFISYQKDHQPQVKELHRMLTSQGYLCWMGLSGTEESLAEADAKLRECKMVIACITHLYVWSPHAHKEITVALNLKKPIIPLLFEKMAWPPQSPLALLLTESPCAPFRNLQECTEGEEKTLSDNVLEKLQAVLG